MACGVLEGLYCMAGGVARVLIRAAGMFAEAAAHAAAFVCRMILFLYESGSRWISALPGSLLRGRPQTARVILYALMLGGLIVSTLPRTILRGILPEAAPTPPAEPAD